MRRARAALAVLLRADFVVENRQRQQRQAVLQQPAADLLEAGVAHAFFREGDGRGVAGIAKTATDRRKVHPARRPAADRRKELRGGAALHAELQVAGALR